MEKGSAVSPRSTTNTPNNISSSTRPNKIPLIQLTDPGGPSHGVTQLDEPTTSNQTLGARMKLVKSPPARLLKLRDSHFLFMENTCPDDFLEEEVEMSRNEVF